MEKRTRRSDMERICRLTGGNSDYPSAAESFLCRTLAFSRHKWRVRTTLDAAFSLAGGDPAGAYLVLQLDLNGVGGPHGAGGEGKRTDRLLMVGSGRWHAGDGSAYHSASMEALREFGWRAEVKPSNNGFMAEVIWDGKVIASQITLEWILERGIFPWALSFVKRKLMDGYKANDDLEGWAELYNQLVQVPSGYMKKYSELDLALFGLELTLDSEFRGIQWPDPIRFSREIAGETQQSHVERLLRYADDESRRRNYDVGWASDEVRRLLGLSEAPENEGGVVQIK